MVPMPQPREVETISGPQLHHAPRTQPLGRFDGPMVADETDTSWEPRHIVQALKYHWFLITVVGTLLAGTLGTAAWHLFPAKYTTTALLRVDSSNAGLLGVDVQTVRNEFLTFLRTQADAIRSENVLRAALRDSRIGNTQTLQTRDDPVRWLQENVVVDFSEHSELMKVSMTGEHAGECAEIINAINDAYIKEVVQIDQLKKKAVLDTLDISRSQMEERVKNLKLQLELKRKPAVRADNATPPDGLPLKSRLGSAEFARLQEEYRRADLNFRLAEHRLQLILSRREKIEAQQPTKQEVEEALTRDPQLRVLTQKAEHLEKQLRYLRGSYADPDHPDVLAVAARWKSAQDEVEEYRRRQSNEFIRQYQAILRKSLEAEIDKANVDVSLRDSARQLLKQQLENVAPPPVELVAHHGTTVTREKDPAEYDLDESSLVYAINTYEDLLRRQNQQSVEVQASKPRVRIWQKASVPIKREMKKQIALTLAAAFFGFVVVGAGIVLYEGRVQRMFSSRDIVTNGMALLGTLPEISGADSLNDASTVKADPFMEGVEKVRLFLARQALGKRSSVVVVSSAEAGTGKTTFAGHLAVCMTRSDRKTLLVDGNLRRPALHEHLGMQPTTGVCELLRSDLVVGDVVRPTSLPNLWFLPAGSWDAQAQHALGRDRFRSILDKLRHDFDVIIIDTHDLATVADTYQMAQHSDAFLLCARKYVSRRPAVEAAYEKICRLGVPHTGVIFLGESTV
jgi:succinoglycan biosynthesis transport protein ExoP